MTSNVNLLHIHKICAVKRNKCLYTFDLSGFAHQEMTNVSDSIHNNLW
jgi:hypothetical protein